MIAPEAYSGNFATTGTDQYIAPEAYSGNVSPAGDMWALGVIVFVFMTGSFPFHSKLFDDAAGENWVSFYY